jgi:protocatechuate 3,4-dioxygenase beta subunit
MLTLSRTVSRRSLLGALAGAGTLLTARGGYAEALRETARTTEGPFYPDGLPLDTDNDLLILNDTLTPSTGRIAWLSGRILGSTGEPVRNAMVEIWQCDAKGSYLHTKGRTAERDPNFQGYGRFLTGATGE